MHLIVGHSLLLLTVNRKPSQRVAQNGSHPSKKNSHCGIPGIFALLLPLRLTPDLPVDIYLLSLGQRNSRLEARKVNGVKHAFLNLSVFFVFEAYVIN